MTNTMTDLDLLAIVALLPIAAVMTIVQTNPYHALVVRGILGATAALVYALLGAADVALTEALVGTMLAITLYVVAVRSSLVLQVGVLAESPKLAESLELAELPELAESRELPDLQELPNSTKPAALEPLLEDLRVLCRQHFLRLELLTYADHDALHTALKMREVHATATLSSSELTDSTQLYTITVRVQRLYDLMQTELNPAIVALHPTFPVEVPSTAPQNPKASTP